MRHLISSLFVLTLTLNTGCLVDIRPDSLLKDNLEHVELERRGRALLDEAAKAHGQDAWQEVTTYSVSMRDTWQGFLIKRQSPWPESEVDVTLHHLANTFDAQAILESGAHEGEVWGMQSWRTYTMASEGQQAVFAEHAHIAFILPAIQYLQEFIFRTHRAPIVRAAGEVMVRGKVYESVLVTWEKLEAHTGADQYMVYLEPETHHVAKIQYTVRDAFRFVQGTIHFDDLRDVDGVLWPFTQSVTLGLDDDPATDYAHLMKLGEVTLNEVSPERFRVDPGISKMGDAKP